MLIISNVGSTALPNVTVTSTSFNESCYLSGDGAIDVTITGPNTGPYTYQWSNGATTQDLTNISSNHYQLMITDASSNCMTLWDTISSVGTNCGTISGNVYIDNNNDCNKNIGDNNSSGTLVIINPGNRIGYTNLQGDYSVSNLPYGTYSVSLNTLNTHLLATCNTTIQAAVNAGTPNATNADLSLGFSSGTQPDMGIYSHCWGIVPGFLNHMYYTLNNLTNVPANGLLKVTLPSPFIMAITSVSPSTYTVSGDTIIWDFSAITYYNGSSFYIGFTTLLSTPLGSLFESCAYAQPIISDFNVSNNTFCYQRIVTGSYDPNDKTVSPVGIGPNGDIAATETDLTYLIRFQNTGNGPAVNIVVRDTLSLNVDINTFEMLSASHNYSIDILDGNVLRWKFNNIMLPDSNSNEPASHGYIQYRIKRNNTNTPGTQIKNTAYIYFDFNEPVVTNTALNTIETITSITEKTNDKSSLLIYPNPTHGKLKILIIDLNNKENLSLKLTDVLGKEVLNETYQEEIDISSLQKGVYFLYIYDEKRLIGTKKLIKN